MRHKLGCLINDQPVTRIFVSLPFLGRRYEEVQIEIDRIRRIANKRLHTLVQVIPSYILVDAPSKREAPWYLSKSIERMSDADYVFFHPRWREGRGCHVEHLCCELYDIPMIELTEEDLKS